MRFLAAIAVILALAGCANQPVPVATVLTNPVAAAAVKVEADFVSQISQFTAKDLAWAVADATKRNDVVSLPCWTYLAGLAAGLPQAGADLPPLGVASAIQAARDGLSIGSGIPAPFQAACGALILDTQVRIAALGVGAAGVVATGGALAPAAGIGAASISALPAAAAAAGKLGVAAVVAGH